MGIKKRYKTNKLKTSHCVKKKFLLNLVTPLSDIIPSKCTYFNNLPYIRT